MAAALDATAAALLGIWESAREDRQPGVRAQLRAVTVVEQFDGINLRRLATRLGMLLSSASRLCDRLVAAGMLEREPGRFDRREIALHLTPEARRLLAELRADRQAQLAAVLAAMSPAGRDALLEGCGNSTGSPAASRRRAPPPWAVKRKTKTGRRTRTGPVGGRGLVGRRGGPTRAVWTGSSGSPERSAGTTREWPTDGPPVARTA
ncbi:MarR family transcriptional regulator [Micromonospora sp. M12]